MSLKMISILGGELMGCDLAVCLAKTVCEQLDLGMCGAKYFVRLYHRCWWIYGEPRNFHPFVANRVAEEHAD